MNRPSPLFNGKTPTEVMKTDPEAVEAELVRIDHGGYLWSSLPRIHNAHAGFVEC